MFAIEFEADIKDGVLKVPREYTHLQNSHAKVLLMVAQESAAEPVVAALDFSTCRIPAFADQDAVAVQRKMRAAW